MEVSILLARILTALYLSVGVGMSFNKTYYNGALNSLLNDETYRFLGGWVAASVGVVMVQFHNIWVNDWRLLVTLVAWVALLKGVMLLAFPRFVNWFAPMFSPRSQRNYLLPMMFILGFIFGWFGFFA